MSIALERLMAFPLGTRVVIRFRFENGATDALGLLSARDESSVTVITRSGATQVMLDEVLLAKQVPPPPARPRTPRL